jgi:surface antigen
VTVVVEPAVIDAVDDDLSASPVNGYTGATAIANALDNDTLNGVAVIPAELTLAPVTTGPLTVNADGTVDVASGTAAGTYTVDYTICEILNPTNCDTATVTVVVEAAVIDAVENDLSLSPVNGYDGATNIANVLDNDTLNGGVVIPAEVTLAAVTSGPLTVNADGTVDVASGTAAGTYTLDYTICEILNPTNCDTATVTIVVEPAVIDAVENDLSLSPVNGYDGATAFINVLDNDTLNGLPVDPNEIGVSITSNGVLTINADGTLDVAPKSAAGTYVLFYTICEILNPTNCDMASVTVVVEPAVIDAVEDDLSLSAVNGYDGATGIVNVLDNDTLNGAVVIPAEVTLAPVTSGPLTVNADGTVDVAAGTAAGTYTVDYTICEILNPTNCDTATVTVVVEPAVIDAVEDDLTLSTVNGYDGAIGVANVLDNDTLNGAVVIPAEVSLTAVTSGPLTINADGTVDVAPQTAAGTYNIDYTICEILNPTNCDTATVTVVVEPAVIDAVEDDLSLIPVDGYNGETGIANVLNNDTLNGTFVIPTEVSLTVVTSGPLTVNADGTVDVAAQTAAGTYTIDYTICEILNPTNCDTTTVTVVVTAAVIDAVDDDLSLNPLNGYDGETGIANVLDNDILNGAVVIPAEVTLAPVTSGPLTVNADGTVDVSALTAAGTYTIDYTICEILNPTNCDTATVTVVVEPTVIDAVEDDLSLSPVNGYDGASGIANVLNNDTLNGAVVIPAEVTLAPVTSGPLTVNADGTVDVAAQTSAGTYTIDYTICEILNPTNCDTATVTVVVEAGVIDAVENDLSSSPVNGYDGAIGIANVLDNDTLNGLAVNTSEVLLTAVTSGPLAINDNGTVDVAPLTAAGTYTIDYTICEILNPTNCDTTTVTVVVELAVIDAVEDDLSSSPVNGYDGAIGIANVLDNDTLNDVQLIPSEVTLATVTSGPLTVNADGTVDVATQTAAGTYTIDYTICEILFPGNCDTATVTVVVVPAVIDAVEDDLSLSPVNGYDGATNITNVLDNDTLNGTTVIPAQLRLAPITVGPLTVNADGNVDVAPKTAAGSYTIDYTICEILNPGNCDSATVTIAVESTIIIANDDDLSNTSVNGDAGVIGFVNVLDNDTLNNIPVLASEVTITAVTFGPITVNDDGTADISPQTEPGTYTLQYTICQISNPAFCDSAVITVVVDCLGSPQNDCDGDGVTNSQEVLDGTDPENACDFLIASITLMPTGPYLLSDCDGDGVTNALEINNGTNPEDSCDYVAGNQTLPQSGDYLIFDCDGDGVVNGTELADQTDPLNPCDFNPPNVTVERSGDFLMADCDGDTISNGQEITDGTNAFDACSSIGGVAPAGVICDIYIDNDLVGPNVDEGFFRIQNIEYVQNIVEIYNRWGKLVYHTNDYDNSSRIFRGFKQKGGGIQKTDELPSGIYYYIINYRINDENRTKTGYLFFTQ